MAGSESLSEIGCHHAINRGALGAHPSRAPHLCPEPFVRIIRVGRDAALVEVASSHEAVSLAAWARSSGLARDAVPGAETVLLDGLLEALVDLDALAARLATWEPAGSGPGPEVEVPVTYDGPDLEAVARHWGCDVADVVRRHQATAFESAFCGFAPGFAYLTANRCGPARRAEAGDPADPGAGRVGRPGRAVVRRLPGRLARRLADHRPHRRRALGPRPPRAGAAGARHPGRFRVAGHVPLSQSSLLRRAARGRRAPVGLTARRLDAELVDRCECRPGAARARGPRVAARSSAP